MAKYVCDFEQVTAIGEKLCALASDFESNISNYSSKISSDLVSWNGISKDNFTLQCDEQVDSLRKTANKVSELGEYIKTSSNNIEDLEESLATLSI